MPEYLILSKHFSTENPAYALVDDDKYPNQVVCCTGPPGNKGHWNIIPDVLPGSAICFLQLSDDTDGRLAERDDRSQHVRVLKTGSSWVISPPLCQGGPDTPRTISTAVNDIRHISEWIIHGKPEDGGTPDSLVSVNNRVFDVAVDPKSFWYIQEVPKA